MKNNPGIIGMSMPVEYDRNVLSLLDKECKNGSALIQHTSMTKPKPTNPKGAFVWDAMEPGEVLDGDIVKIVFQIAPDAQVGNTKVHFTVQNVRQDDGSFYLFDGKEQKNFSFDAYINIVQ